MASLRKKKDSYFIRFRLGGRPFERDVGENEARAEATKKRVEATLMDIKNGRLKVPEEGDIAQFVVSDGQTTSKPKLPEILTVADLFHRYEEALPEGTLEPTTMTTYRIHRNHLIRIFGTKVAAQSIGSDELQAYIKKRGSEGVVRDTIKKEISTFSSVWNWAAYKNLLTGPCRTRGLKYPKAKEKPPFMTWGEIERVIGYGSLTDDQISDLWDCLFLDTNQIAEVLAHVRATARQPFIFPMFAFVALTGCRRSEMIRSQRGDVKIETSKVNIREKKRDTSIKITFRYVDVHPFLAPIMKEWDARHPGGPYTFCHTPNVPLTPKEAWGHFERTLAGSKWTVLRGFHVFRHSFASNLARAGVDQRVIDEFLGHQTEQMRRRYRHLFPDTKQSAIQAAFGTTTIVSRK